MEQNSGNNDDFPMKENPRHLLDELEKKLEVMIENKKELTVENFNLKEKLKDISHHLKEILEELKRLKSERG